MAIKIQEQSSPNLWCIQPLKIGCKLDIKILQAHVFILRKNGVYLEKQVSWKQKLMGRKWPYTYNEFQLPSFAA